MGNVRAVVVEVGQAARILSPIPLVPLGARTADGAYDEKWLQLLIQRCPEVLATADIEPGFGQLVPVSMEVACGHGYIDNLFVTPDGGIALVETKLWRNQEARRHVVAQTLDYAAALARMSFTEFENAALAGEFLDLESKPKALHELVAGRGDALAEADFIDAVTTNLRRGRMLVLAVGDGVRTESEALADLLQSNAGARFTFALVAIELFALPSGGIVAVPRNVAKTVLIERGVVRIADDRIIVDPPPVSQSTAPTRARVTMTEELFMEQMAKISPSLPATLREFLDQITPLGVNAEWLGSLNLKWAGWPDGPVNLGYISKTGNLQTDASNWKVGAERARRYNEELAALAGGVTRDQGAGAFVLGPDGKRPVRIDTLLPAKADAWIDLMRGFVERLQAELARSD